MNEKPNTKYHPDAEYRYFLYDPDDGMTYYYDKDVRDKEAQRAIDGYLDTDGWSEMVNMVTVGEVTHVSTQTNIQRPKGKLDEDGLDEDGRWWHGPHDYRCNYKLLPIPEVAA